MPKSPSITRYLNELSNTKKISKNELESLLYDVHDESLATAIRDNARTRIVEAFQPLVYSVAKKYGANPQRDSFLDYIQNGNIGLLRAIRRFDPTRGVAFITYATLLIRYEILNIDQRTAPKSINDSDIVSLSILSTYKMVDWLRARNQLEKLYTDIEISENIEDIIFIKNILNRVLAPRERDIIIQRYVYDKSIREIAKKYNYSLANINKITQIALKKIRENMKDDK